MAEPIEVKLGKEVKVEKGLHTYNVKGADGKLLGAVVGEGKLPPDTLPPVFKVTAFAKVDPKDAAKTLPPEPFADGKTPNFGVDAPFNTVDFTAVMQEVSGRATVKKMDGKAVEQNNAIAVEVTGIKVGDKTYDKDTTKLKSKDKVFITVHAGNGDAKHAFEIKGKVIDDIGSNKRIKTLEMISPEGKKCELDSANQGILLREKDLQNPEIMQRALTEPAESAPNPFQEIFRKYAAQKDNKEVGALNNPDATDLASLVADFPKMLFQMLGISEVDFGSLQPKNTQNLAQAQQKGKDGIA